MFTRVINKVCICNSDMWGHTFLQHLLCGLEAKKLENQILKTQCPHLSFLGAEQVYRSLKLYFWNQSRSTGIVEL